MKVKHLMLLLAIASIAGYPKSSDAKVNYGASWISALSSSSSSLSSLSSSLGKKKAFSYGDIYLEPDDGLIFSIEEMVDEIDGYEVLSGPRTTGDGYYESCIVAFEGNQIEITV